MDRYYEMITPDNSSSLSVVQLIEMYNEAVETIWILQKRLLWMSFQSISLSVFSMSIQYYSRMISFAATIPPWKLIMN